MIKEILGLPRWFSGKKSPCQCRRHRFDSWVRKSPWRRKWQPTPVFLPGESYRQGNLAGYSLWGHKRVGHDLATKQQKKTETLPARREWNNMFKIFKYKNYQPRTLYAAKLSFKYEGERNLSPDKEKLRDFPTLELLYKKCWTELFKLK